MRSRQFLQSMLAATVGLFALGAASSVHAQAYPGARPITMIVPFAAGGATDVLARIIAQGLGEKLGQRVVVDNRGGAGGMIGLEAVAKAPADGYTVLFSGFSTNVLTPAIGQKTPYDPVNDFVPVGITNEIPLVYVATTQLPPRTLREFIDYAKPRQVPFITAGPGSSAAVLGAAFLQTIGAKGDAIAYKSSSIGLLDMLPGRVWFLAGESPAVVQGHVREGRLVGLAVTGSRRLPTLPDVPTMAEAWPEAPQHLRQSIWNAMWVPAKVPRDVLMKLNTELRRTMSEPAIREKMEAVGIPPLSITSPEEAQQRMRRDLADWTRVATQTGITKAIEATAK